MADRVQIVLEAQDIASGVIRGITAQLGSFGEVASDLNDVFAKGTAAQELYQKSLTDTSISAEQVKQAQDEAGMASARLAETIATVVIDVLKQSYEAYTKLAESVRDLSLVSGETAESTSRFIQVLDDFQLTADDAMTAARALKEQGLSPNIETLAQLSDEFKKIKDPAERMAFIQENLGRGGAKWVNVLNQGGDALRSMSSEISKNLILTDQQIVMYEVQRTALDNLADAWEGFWVQLGQNIGTVVAYKQAQLRATEILQEQGVVINAHTHQTQEYKDAVEQAIAEQLKAAEASVTATESYVSQEEEVLRLAEATRAMTEANTEALSLAMSISEENASYNEKLAETIAEYGEASEEVASLKEEHSAALLQMGTDLEIAKLKAGEFTDAEYEMAIALLESTGQMDAAAAQTARAMDAIATAAQAAGEEGMVKYGEILKAAMEDGNISIQEQQQALDELNSLKPVEEIGAIPIEMEAAKDEGVASIDALQLATDSYTTAGAIEQINNLEQALLSLPPLPTAPIAPQQDVRNGAGVNGGGQIFNIANANFYQNESGTWSIL